MSLRPCPACRRHAAVAAVHCVFCAAPLPAAAARPPVPRGRLSPAAVFGAALASSACWSSASPAPPSGDPARATGDVPAAEGGAIEGTVTSATEGAFAGWQVTLTGPDGQTRQLRSDDLGRFRFEGLAPGRYTVRWDATLPRGRRPVAALQADQQVDVADGATARVELMVAVPAPQLSPSPMPYGAPPARHRVV